MIDRHGEARIGPTEATKVPAEIDRCWRLLTARLEQETDPLVRRSLEVVRRHVEIEYLGDIVSLMDTFVAEPRHEYLGAVTYEPLVGAGPVQASYEREVTAGGRHVFDLARVVADPSSVVLEGSMRSTAPGAGLLADGTPGAEDIDPAAWYVLEYPALVVLPISPDGLIEAERVYFGERPRVAGVLGTVERTYLGPHASAPVDGH